MISGTALGHILGTITFMLAISVVIYWYVRSSSGGE
jgi:hypothetical protein